MAAGPEPVMPGSAAARLACLAAHATPPNLPRGASTRTSVQPAAVPWAVQAAAGPPATTAPAGARMGGQLGSAGAFSADSSAPSADVGTVKLFQNDRVRVRECRGAPPAPPPHTHTHTHTTQYICLSCCLVVSDQPLPPGPRHVRGHFAGRSCFRCTEENGQPCLI